MFYYCSGDLFDSEAQALVNTVNCKGVMGKGLAKEFKARFPENYRRYREKCQNGSLVPGTLFCWYEKEKYIVNFPTKDDWRKKSKISYIIDGLNSLSSWIQKENIKSIALPPLGCGNGGLSWSSVRPLIEQKLMFLADSVDIYVYGEPSSEYLEQKIPKIQKAADNSENVSNENTVDKRIAALEFLSEALDKNHRKCIPTACCIADQILRKPFFGISYSFSQGKYFLNGLKKEISPLIETEEKIKKEDLNLDPCVQKVLQKIADVVLCFEDNRECLILLRIIKELQASDHQCFTSYGYQQHENLKKKLPKLSDDDAEIIVSKIEKILFEEGLATRCGLLDGFRIQSPQRIAEFENEYCITASDTAVQKENSQKEASRSTACKVEEKRSDSGHSQISINSADQEILCQLEGIGPELALRIVNYRETSGGFKHIEDLKRVKGIGNKKYDMISGFICL